MKGLVQFIADLRNARAHEAEAKRVNAELANIRQKFRDTNLNGYNKKKYVCKLIYMYILGYDIDIGHVESVSLISSSKYSEKQIGYLSISLMLNENDDLLDMVVNSIRKDLQSSSDLNTCLALSCIATVGGKSIGNALYNEVFKLLISPTSANFVRKKAALTMLRLYRKDSQIMQPTWPNRIMALLDDPDLGVTTCVVSLVIALVQDDPETYKSTYAKVVRRLQAIILNKEIPEDYIYYQVPTPWLLIKLFRLLQYYPPSSDETVQSAIRKVIFNVVELNSTTVKNIQQNNAQNAVLFEVINLAIHLDLDQILLSNIVEALGAFLKSTETNVRYLSLNAMANLAARYEHAPVKKYLITVIHLLRDRDISVRRKAIDLLYCLCDAANVKTIVHELLKYLQSADFAIREDMVIRIAILTEKYANDYKWYVDTSLRLIAIAGNHVSDEVWQRVVQIVVNNESLQVYAARNVLEHFKHPTCHENMLKIGGYVLGEYGHLIADEPGCSPIEQFLALHDKFPSSSPFTRAFLLSTYVKFVNLFAEIKPQIVQVFEFYSTSIDPELQQRACEYLRLVNHPNTGLLPTVWDEMPPFPERTSALLSRLHAKHALSEDKRIWSLGNKVSQTERTALNLNTRGPQNVPRALSFDANKNTDSITNSAAEKTEKRHAPPPPVPRKLSAGANGATEILFSSGWEVNYRELLFSREGVLYEDSLMQIRLKSEYRRHLGCVILHFRNTSGEQLTSLSVELSNPSGNEKLHISTKNFPDSTIPPDGSTEQVIIMDAKQPFEESPIIKITYMAGALKVVTLKLPIILEKFMEATNLPGEDYFKRWKQIVGDNLECQKVFRNISSQALPGTFPKVLDEQLIMKGINWSNISGVDKSTNIVGASIIHTSQGGNFGCLVRLEPNEEKTMYRVTIRATDERIPSILVKNLFTIYQL